MPVCLYGRRAGCVLRALLVISPYATVKPHVPRSSRRSEVRTAYSGHPGVTPASKRTARWNSSSALQTLVRAAAARAPGRTTPVRPPPALASAFGTRASALPRARRGPASPRARPSPEPFCQWFGCCRCPADGPSTYCPRCAAAVSRVIIKDEHLRLRQALEHIGGVPSARACASSSKRRAARRYTTL